VARGPSVLHRREGVVVDGGGTSIFGLGGLYRTVCTRVEGVISLRIMTKPKE